MGRTSRRQHGFVVLIIVIALEQVRLGKTVAIVVLYRKSLPFLVAVLGKLREQDDRVRDIVAESPESIQGSTVQCCHFLCLQSRCRDERMLAVIRWTVKGDGLD